MLWNEPVIIKTPTASRGKSRLAPTPEAANARVKALCQVFKGN
jgi:hypothetical protein